MFPMLPAIDMEDKINRPDNMYYFLNKAIGYETVECFVLSTLRARNSWCLSRFHGRKVIAKWMSIDELKICSICIREYQVNYP